ncbi:endonuclease MutS2 [Marinicrinis lubricantis]|uniref:Endonuclease MutS2 n=1 Tax=Marinicrinis lubricantis TaxID=2086470 RepID=A0ABW1ILH4_9BACL
MDTKIFHTLEFTKIRYKLADQAATALGKEAAAVLTPSSELPEVTHRLQATYEASEVIRLKGPAPFGGIKKLSASLQRTKVGGVLNALELTDIGNTVYGTRRLKQHIMQVHENRPLDILVRLSEQIEECRELEREIKDCIDDQAEVMDQASPELARIRRELRSGESRIREKLEQMIKSPSTLKKLQEGLVTIRNDRYVIPVKQEYRSHFGGIVHDQSASGATLFIEPEAIVTMNNRLRELKLQEEREIEKILTRLSSLVAEQHDALALNQDVVMQLDFHFAKAALAYEMKASLPKMNQDGYIRLKKGRHPLIDPSVVVPLDIEIGKQFTSVIITGPNTGGKTVTLKTLGLLSLMAMSGLFVPAEDGSEMCVFDGVYADIGDEQSIEQNLSTFSSHLTNIIRILNEMTPNSLVLLDEVGAGTDPAEGSALAISILEHIHRTGCRLVATTHYSELKAYAYNREGVLNASMEFDVQSLSPTYRLLLGIPGRSNAFAIAKRLGLHASIIEKAQGQIGEEDQKVDTMIASLEANRIRAESERDQAEQLRIEADRLRSDLEQQRQRLEEQKAKLMEKAQQEAQQAVAKAKKEADEIIAELRSLAMEEQASIKEHKLIDAKTRLDRAVPSLPKSAPRKKAADTAEVEPGDEVYVHSFGQKGHVVEESGKNEVIVQLGIMKMKVKRSDLELVKKSASEQKQVHVSPTVKRSKGEQVSTELDLRGATLEEALMEVDRFIDESLLANLTQIYIIHGKGTGALRSGVQEFLKKHKHVANFRLGNYGEGGTGITVAELK